MQLGEQDDLRNTVEQMRAAGASGDDLGLLEVLFALRQGDLAGAQQHLGSLTPESPSQQYGQALLAILQGDHASAQQHLERVIAGNEPLLRPAARTLQDAYAEYLLFPESPNSHLVTLLGRALAQIQECALALPLLTQVTGMQVDYRDAWIMRGFCELGLQRAPEAIASFERAYALDPEKPETQYYLGRAYGRSGDHRNAVTYLSYAVRNGFQPEREARQALATQALALGDQTLALEQLTTILDLPDPQPEDLEAYVITAVQAGESAKAIERLRAQLALTPNDARLHDLLGLSLATNGDTEAARDALQRALDLNPRLESARQRLNAL
jgi:tetratricopeptide (TPR) repeat protein